MKINKEGDVASAINLFHPKFPWASQKLSEPENPKVVYEDSENPIDEFPNAVHPYGPSLGKGKRVYETCTKLYTTKTIDNYRKK
jgi:hypothetical protein